MILAKITGEVHPEDSRKIEVEFTHGVKRYVRPCMVYPFVFVPSKEWLDSVKEDMLAWIFYEEDNVDKPVYVGFLPKKGSSIIPNGFPSLGYIDTAKFRITIDDKKEELEIKHKEGEVLKVSKEEIYVGKNAKEPALLGDTSVTLLVEILDIIKGFSGTYITPAGSPAPVVLNPDYIISIELLKEKLETAKSKIIKVV